MTLPLRNKKFYERTIFEIRHLCAEFPDQDERGRSRYLDSGSREISYDQFVEHHKDNLPRECSHKMEELILY